MGYVSQTGSFCAEKDMEIDIELVPAETNPDIDPELPAEWGNFRGNDDNNGVTDAKTPTSADNAELYWATSIATGGQANGAPGTPIIINGELYSYSGKELLRLDAETGEVLARGEMQAAHPSPSAARVCRGHDLRGARRRHGAGVQREDAGILWLYTDSLGIGLGANQPNCPITYSDGCIYTGFWNSEQGAAHMVCLTITDEDPSQPLEAKQPLWVRTQSGGFYWAGALATEKFVLVGTEDGEKGYESQTSMLLSLNPVSGALLDSIEGLNGDIRSTVSYDAATDSYYFTSGGGSFYSVKVPGKRPLCEGQPEGDPARRTKRIDAGHLQRPRVCRRAGRGAVQGVRRAPHRRHRSGVVEHCVHGQHQGQPADERPAVHRLRRRGVCLLCRQLHARLAARYPR